MNRAPRRPSRRPRRALLLGALLGALLLAFALRALVVGPRYAVTSIATLAAYQDPALLRRARALPVAVAYGPAPLYQRNGSTCGPASVATVLRSLAVPGASEAAILSGSGKCRTGLCLGGLTLDEVAALAAHKGPRPVTVLRDLTMEQLRAHLRMANDPRRRYLVNFHRGLLFGRGGGHHSPVGGYLADLDLAYVLDVNERFGPWLVPAERLFLAVDTVDPASGRKRGLVLLGPP